MVALNHRRIAFLATDRFEDSELTSPWNAVFREGGEPTMVSTGSGAIEGKNGHSQPVDMTSAEATAADFDALVLPGGTNNADRIRLDPEAVRLVREFHVAGKPIAAICHGAWILTDADAVRGKTITSFPSLRTDLTNAGATWVDQEVVVDDPLVSSRTPEDLPAFNDAAVKVISGT